MSNWEKSIKKEICGIDCLDSELCDLNPECEELQKYLNLIKKEIKKAVNEVLFYSLYTTSQKDKYFYSISNKKQILDKRSINYN